MSFNLRHALRDVASELAYLILRPV